MSLCAHRFLGNRSATMAVLTVEQRELEKKMAIQLGESEYRTWLKERNETMAREAIQAQEEAKKQRAKDILRRAMETSVSKSDQLLQKRRETILQQQRDEEQRELEQKRLEAQDRDRREKEESNRIELERQKQMQKLQEEQELKEKEQMEKEHKEAKLREEAAEREAKRADGLASAEKESEQRLAAVEVALNRMVLVECEPFDRCFALPKDIAATRDVWTEEDVGKAHGIQLDKQYVEKIKANITPEVLKKLHDVPKDDFRKYIGSGPDEETDSTPARETLTGKDKKLPKGQLKKLVGDEDVPKSGLVRRLSAKWEDDDVVAQRKKKKKKAKEASNKSSPEQSQSPTNETAQQPDTTTSNQKEEKVVSESNIIQEPRVAMETESQQNQDPPSLQRTLSKKELKEQKKIDKANEQSAKLAEKQLAKAEKAKAKEEKKKLRASLRQSKKEKKSSK